MSSTIDLPRPRNEETRESPRYFELVTAVREGLRAGGGLESRRGQVWRRPERTMAEGAVG